MGSCSRSDAGSSCEISIAAPNAGLSFSGPEVPVPVRRWPGFITGLPVRPWVTLVRIGLAEFVPMMITIARVIVMMIIDMVIMPTYAKRNSIS